MCLYFNAIKTAEEDTTFYKEVHIQDGKFITPYQEVAIEVGKEYTLDTDLEKLVANSKGVIGSGVFHLYVGKPKENGFFLKTIVKKGENYLKGITKDVGVTRVRYEYLDEEDEKKYEKSSKYSKKYRVISFDGNFYSVLKDNKCNFIDEEGKLLSKKWFDWVGDFSKGFARVELYGKGYNFINTEGKLLSDKWFDWVEDFYGGFAGVRLNGKCNFIDTEGKLLSEKWFDYIGNFHEGFVLVRLNGKYNFINTEGEFLFEQWFDYVYNFYEGFAKVKLNGEWKKIDTNGNFV